MKRAACTWGDGPDVVLDLKDDTFILYENPIHVKSSSIYGHVTKGSMDLTADEALALAAHLEAAANNAKELERTCREHDEEVANRAKAFEIFEEIAYEYDEYLEGELIDSMCEMNRSEMQKMTNVPKYVGDPLSEKDLMAILADHPLDTLTCYKCPHRDTCKYVDDLYNTHGDCLAMK